MFATYYHVKTIVNTTIWVRFSFFCFFQKTIFPPENYSKMTCDISLSRKPMYFHWLWTDVIRIRIAFGPSWPQRLAWSRGSFLEEKTAVKNHGPYFVGVFFEQIQVHQTQNLIKTVMILIASILESQRVFWNIFQTLTMFVELLVFHVLVKIFTFDNNSIPQQVAQERIASEWT